MTQCDIFSTTGKSPILSFRRHVKTRNKKYSAFQKTKISGICCPVPAQRGTYRAIVTARRVGMRWTQSCDTFFAWTTAWRRTAKSCGPGAATVASIRPACVGSATVTKNAAHRGEHEVSRKAIAWGKPGCLGCTCSPCPCAKHMGCPCALAHGIYGRSQRPAFPAPSLRRGTTRLQNSGKSRPRERDRTRRHDP